MSQLVSPGFLFRWKIPVTEQPRLPHRTGQLLNLPVDCRIPSLAELDGKKDFADIRLAWNQSGFGISVEVRGRSTKPAQPSGLLMVPDGLTIWIDTRNTQGVHRATRFCHQFYLRPLGAGRKSAEPSVEQITINRAREEATAVDLSDIQLQSEIRSDGYLLEAWFPAAVFIGFDPANSPLLGFHYELRDTEFGEQSLVVGREFPASTDPSLWQTLQLIPA